MTPNDIAEAERIKDRIRATTCRDDMETVRNEEIDAIEKLEQRPGCEVFGIEIRNLASHMQKFCWAHDAAKLKQKTAQV